mmetsp:Transcript_25644/g.74118  ORF Transcript_25644/g.74118 Transcript_25644/m.74118 type:complete len:297 (+) Transcript_25644:212-1102(+)
MRLRERMRLRLGLQMLRLLLLLPQLLLLLLPLLVLLRLLVLSLLSSRRPVVKARLGPRKRRPRLRRCAARLQFSQMLLGHRVPWLVVGHRGRRHGSEAARTSASAAVATNIHGIFHSGRIPGRRRIPLRKPKRPSGRHRAYCGDKAPSRCRSVARRSFLLQHLMHKGGGAATRPLGAVQLDKVPRLAMLDDPDSESTALRPYPLDLRFDSSAKLSWDNETRRGKRLPHQCEVVHDELQHAEFLLEGRAENVHYGLGARLHDLSVSVARRDHGELPQFVDFVASLANHPPALVLRHQ